MAVDANRLRKSHGIKQEFEIARKYNRNTTTLKAASDHGESTTSWRRLGACIRDRTEFLVEKSSM